MLLLTPFSISTVQGFFEKGYLKQNKYNYSALYISKLCLSLLLIIVCVAEIVIYFTSQGSFENNDFIGGYVTPIIYGVTYLFYLVNEFYSHKYNQKRNGALWFYWLVELVSKFIIFLSLVIPFIEEDNQNSTTGRDFNPLIFPIIYLALTIIQFLLNSFAEPVDLDEKTSTELYCGWPAVLFFSWFSPMVAKGHKKALEVEDLWVLNQADSTAVATRKFLRNYKLPSFMQYNFGRKKEQNIESGDKTSKTNKVTPDINLDQVEKVGLVRAMVKTYGNLFLSASAFKLGNDFLQFLNPIFLNLMIEFISSDQPDWIGYIYAVLMFLGALTVTVCLHQYFHRVFRIGMDIKISLISLIYQKALKLSSESKGETSVGEMVTYMSTDSQRLADTMSDFAQIWSSPLRIVICMVLLYNQLGWSAFAGLAVCILLIPANIWAQGLVRKTTIANMQLKQKRVKKTTEMLNGMKVMKLYSWEDSFKNAINVIRDDELRTLWMIAKLGTVFSVLWGCAPVFISIAAFTTYIYTGTEENPHVLTSSRTFVSVSLFNILRFPLNVLPGIIMAIVQALVSVKRINKYLRSGELDPKTIKRDRNRTGNDQGFAVSMKDCTFAWSDKINPGSTSDDKEDPEDKAKEVDENFSLKDLNLNIKEGSLIAVIGKVGSGKSSLVQAMLGELHKFTGQAELYGKVAYVAQQAWIMNMSLKDNILFGSEFNEENYNQSVKACALVDDIDMLPAGDQTEIGEKGINLSGGQKQRVALARAVYQDCDTFIFDDPLSAVDNHVGKHIFENVLSNDNGCLKGKTRILVTNAMQYVSSCDRVLIIEDGAIAHQGTYEELKSDEQANNKMEAFGIKEEEEEEDMIDESKIELMKQKSKNLNDILAKKKEAVEKKKEDEGKLVEKENTETGNVSFSVFKKYFEACGFDRVILVIFTNLIYVASSSGSRIWLAVWSDESDKVEAEGKVLTNSQNNMYIGVYGAIGVAQVIFVCARTLSLYWASLRASRILHWGLISNIVRLPMAFFDTTPLGLGWCTMVI